MFQFEVSAAQETDEEFVVSAGWHANSSFCTQETIETMSNDATEFINIFLPKIMSLNSWISAQTLSGFSPCFRAISMTSLGRSGPRSRLCETLTGIFLESGTNKWIIGFYFTVANMKFIGIIIYSNNKMNESCVFWKRHEIERHQTMI